MTGIGTRRRTRVALIVGLTVLGALCTRPAAAQPSLDPAQIKQSMQARWSALKNVRATWTVTGEEPDSEKIGESREQGAYLWCSDGRFRFELKGSRAGTHWFAFDGHAYRVYDRYGQEPNGRGYIGATQNPMYSMDRGFFLSPMKLVREVWDRSLTDFRFLAADTKVPFNSTLIGVDQVYAIRVLGSTDGLIDLGFADVTTDTIREYFTVDPQRGYLIVGRRPGVVQGNLLSMKVLETQEVDGITIPTTIETSNPNGGPPHAPIVHRIHLENIVVNGVVSPEDFQPVFPLGTGVRDEVLGMDYRVAK